MMDQIAALRWVNAEIVNFGGNPKKITIFGESAGAGSVSCLTYSPLARGKVPVELQSHRVIHLKTGRHNYVPIQIPFQIFCFRSDS